MIRNTYIIIPLKRITESNINNLDFANGEEIGFDSESMSDIIRHKCSMGRGFVRRFRLSSCGIEVKFIDGFSMAVEDTQLSVFENGIAFLSVLFCVKEDDVSRIYDFINQGYLVDKDKEMQPIFIRNLREKVLEGTGYDIYVEGEDKKLAIKESYIFNAVFTEHRFDTLEALNKTTFNVHRQIAIDSEFKDESEADIAYTYAVRDVENKRYRWGCCISSQSISFAYGPLNSNYNSERKTAIIPPEDMTIQDMVIMAEDDILLTILAMYQRFTCKYFSEQVYNGIYQEGSKRIKSLREQMLRFRAFGTITPSQVSRWNNVCRTYEYLLKMNGVEEALNDISDKINLISEEVNNINSRHQNYIATIIAVFGLVSIVASVQQITDYILRGNSIVRLWTVISCAGIVMVGIAFVVMFHKKT